MRLLSFQNERFFRRSSLFPFFCFCVLIPLGMLKGQGDFKMACGSLERLDPFPAKDGPPFEVSVFLPPGYDASQRYPVLYMHDGQMLYDSSRTWNHQSWLLDRNLCQAWQEGMLPPCIVVGISNRGKYRRSDYFPERAARWIPKDRKKEFLERECENDLRAESYLKFLVFELKPLIDKRYAVLKDRKHTCIAGSSMGGLISLYALCRYPKVFGGAACLSIHWPGSLVFWDEQIPTALLKYFSRHVPDPATHRIYFDHGTLGYDARYAPHMTRMDDRMRQKGYSEKQWVTRVFPGEDHNEKAWSRRIGPALRFLMCDK